MSEIKLNTIEEAIEDFKEGKFIIVVDDEDRENEGDLIIAAEKVTPEKINFMLKNARGVLCAPITISRCEELDLPHQVSNNTSVLGTPFTVTIDKLEGQKTAPRPSRPWPIRNPSRKRLAAPVISIHCMPRKKVSCVVPDIRRPASICAAWRAYIPPPHLWRS